MSLWAADSHVHFHKCFNEGLFFDNCFSNLRKTGSSDITSGILFFTEGKNEDAFNFFKKKNKIHSVLNDQADYSVSGNFSENVIEVSWKEAGMRLLIISGFQIVTKENLEVLSLGTAKRHRDGSLIEDTISNVVSHGGIPVLPWGFGKWFGGRGAKINEIIDRNIFPLFLGDNGGRSNLLPFPHQFRNAEKSKIKILPGSDPLPFTNEMSRALSYGFTFDSNVSDSNPWQCIKETLLSPKFSFEKFGELASPMNFIRTQIAMQIKKRKSR